MLALLCTYLHVKTILEAYPADLKKSRVETKLQTLPCSICNLLLFWKPA